MQSLGKDGTASLLARPECGGAAGSCKHHSDRTCVVAIRQLRDEGVSAGQPCSSVHFLIGGVLAAILDVLPNRASKQDTILAHHSNLGAQRKKAGGGQRLKHSQQRLQYKQQWD